MPSTPPSSSRLSPLPPPHLSPSRTTPPEASPRLPSSPILLHPLPPSSALTAESLAQSELTLDHQTRQLVRERELAEALQEQEWEIQRAAVREAQGTWTKNHKDAGKGQGVKGGQEPSRGFTRPPEAWELYSAIDRHDIDFIMRVRDHAFPLLLQKNAGEFPIVYASRIGPTHRDITILLIGAMSRYVNQLEDEDFGKKATQNILKALRANLKLAIDFALLPSSQSTTLLSSYLQVLIMSEGDSFLHKATYDLSLLLRDPSSQPVAAAERVVRRFCTKELRGVQGGVEGVEEYVANAALDLVIMASWSIAAQQLDVENLPTYTFARDTRTWTLLCEAMAEHQAKLGKVNPRVRRLLERLVDLGGNTRKSIQGRLKNVREELDGHG